MLPSFATERILTLLLGAGAGLVLEGAERLWAFGDGRISADDVLATSAAGLLMPWVLPCALIGLLGGPWLARLIWEEAREDVEWAVRRFWLLLMLFLPAILMILWAMRLYARGEL